MSQKGHRVVRRIEKAFSEIHQREGVTAISVHSVKSWLDDNTRDGMHLMRLANLLSKRPQFKMVRRERKRGTHETVSYWCMDGIGDFVLSDFESYIEKEGTKEPVRDSEGSVWVIDWPKTQ